jgi:hypothetical protein
MEEHMSETNEKETALFMQLVLTFQAAAWQQMGKLKNPVTDKIERSLDQARYSIDMLLMLRAKTRAQLSDDETRFLGHVISELQLNFVDELKKNEQAKTREPGGAPDIPPSPDGEKKEGGE